MSINQLIFRNLLKNLKNYYLYVFALVFSTALYFSFVTLQYDPTMDGVKGSIKGAAGIQAASILLVAIVAVFLLYANNIFIRRRSKEIGLFQLIGLTKNRIFRMLTAENFMLYFGSLVIGVFAGFAVSKLILMILFRVTGVEAIASLHFSAQALLQTVIVFLVIYLLIMLMNYTFIKRQTILALFRVTSMTEGKVKRISLFEIVIGVLGMILIGSGYFVSSKLFGGSFTSTPTLFGAMIFILGAVIIGTYLFYKGSIRFILNFLRNRKKGYLDINQVLSLSSIMFRMKSNALLLTIITTVSAMALALLSLSYISYYSGDKTAWTFTAADFAMTNAKDAEKFKAALDGKGLPYTEKRLHVLQVDANVKDILKSNAQNYANPKFNSNVMGISVLDEKETGGRDVAPEETYFTGYSDLLQRFLGFKDSGTIEWKGKTASIPQKYLGLEKNNLVSAYFTSGGLPQAIVDHTVFEKLKNDLNPNLQKKSSLSISINMKNGADLKKADMVFQGLHLKLENGNFSFYHEASEQKKTMGLTMFIVGFLGLTFLITSGCILYFKQMNESEEEKPNYTILRKLGFTQSDLLIGIQAKQLFNFGIPLVVGLLHSYFAVQSGWFLFGKELWTPTIIVMVLYTALYSIFGILSVFYYKKVIKEAL
ncbi:ABC transporter permease [Metabacillus sp. GX 13764]|uniref:ABC transporter permease n=1 Tax=Metabacillus kandeliae TaxID=2900151 RepID=UPI001E2F535B|nr:ABC transporter permease [Metabacillus kandeliae]MCD7035395.1 ABC transporter permease [Metabacillus kandeliae]